MKTEIVRIRLTPSTYLKYEEAAHLNNMPLSSFLRIRLEESENTVSEISALRSAIHDLRLSRIENDTAKELAPNREAETKALIDPVLAEIVLLLREDMDCGTE